MPADLLIRTEKGNGVTNPIVEFKDSENPVHSFNFITVVVPPTTKVDNVYNLTSTLLCDYNDVEANPN